MDFDEFSQQIEALRSKVTALLQRTDNSPISQQELLKETFEELNIALEELNVAESELQQQNSELWDDPGSQPRRLHFPQHKAAVLGGQTAGGFRRERRASVLSF